MFLGRNKVAVQKDFANGNKHLGACNNCGFSLIAFNPNAEVTYEGLPIIVDGAIYLPHPSPGILGCCLTHDVRARPLSDLASIPTVDDQMVKINGLLPIRLGDLLYCGAEIEEF